MTAELEVSREGWHSALAGVLQDGQKYEYYYCKIEQKKSISKGNTEDNKESSVRLQYIYYKYIYKYIYYSMPKTKLKAAFIC